ncbi:MAG: U32 family peptidase [Clostridia bacterium]|nr:U32 family peptidase [Clostridia bacterium]
MEKKPELLCPVGGQDTLQAALRGGADAVYFGATEFNARMNAKNFDRAALSDAVFRCHEKGVRVYVTLNTLLTDRQIPRAMELVSFLYQTGADALILADRGLSALIHAAFPDLELHASTQASGHNLSAAIALAEAGFTRMVCARELDQKNLKTLCAASPIEIELFVHGAICASHSGQCLMSSMIGDRSGNRGECAQPCRLPYNGGYPLSFKDLSLAGHVEEILSLGVSSLKIEGRMKGASYVYTAASIWRTLLDEGRSATPKEMARLAGAFSRSGFTDGYFTRRLGSDMLGVRTAQDKKITEKTAVSYREIERCALPITLSREPKKIAEPALPPKKKTGFGRSARFLKPEQIPQTDLFREIYLPLAVFDGARANGVILPSVIMDSERPFVRSALEKAVNEGVRHVLVGNLGHLDLVKDLHVTLHGDFRLNITNSFSLSSYPDFADVIVSPELNLAQLRDLRGEKSVIVYGKIPLMLLEKQVGTKCLRDRRGVCFPVIREGGRDVVLNSVPIYMLDREKDLKERGITLRHYIFTTESPQEVKKILSAIVEKAPAKGNVRRIK